MRRLLDGNFLLELELLKVVDSYLALAWSSKMKSITLALGGGGVKGNAHIGVLRVLEREGFDIKALAGSSAGGMVGALYAFGYNADQILELTTRLDPEEAYHRQPGDRPAWLGVAGIRQVFRETLGDCTFDDLRLPFAVTAVDLDTAELVILRTGKVVDAVLATIAVPGVFPSMEWEGRLLVDGALLYPVPVAAARALAPGLPVVAVPLSPPMDEWSGVEKPRLLNSLPYLSNYLARFRSVQALHILMRAMDIGGAMISELMLELDKPEVIIRPILHNIGLLERVDAAQVAKLGETAAELALPELNSSVTWLGRFKRLLAPRGGKYVRLPYKRDFEKLGKEN